MGIPKTFFIETFFKENDSYYVQLKGDSDNLLLFEKRKWCRKPIVGFPMVIENEKAIPCERYDAQIDLKYHLIIFKDAKAEDHIRIESLTSGLTHTITIKDLRPIIIN